MRRLFVVLFPFLLVPAGLLADGLPTGAALQEPKVIPLWPGPPPGSESWDYPENEVVGPEDGILRISNVTRPTLTIFLPEPSVATGTAVVVCPGGGFRILAFDHEGIQVAKSLASRGIAAFVLKYRVMRTGDADESNPATMGERRKAAIPLAIADAQQAIRLARTHAAEWGIARERIGILGFSAGGYVTASVALHHDPESRPDFVASINPGTPDDVTPPSDAAPLFLVHADNDKTVSAIPNSIRLYEAWKKAGVSAEVHIYSQGGHGFGMKKTGLPAAGWVDRFYDWLNAEGLLKRPH